MGTGELDLQGSQWLRYFAFFKAGLPCLDFYWSLFYNEKDVEWLAEQLRDAEMKKFNSWMMTVALFLVFGLNACGMQDSAVGSENGRSQTKQVDSSGTELEPAPGNAGRQPVEIKTADGRVLEGFYYPSKQEEAPAIVLMHWAPGSMDDWDPIARWLQNQPENSDAPQSGKSAYQDSSWFPEMPAEVSFAVLTFNFGDYGTSQYGGSRESLVEDARAALQYAATLPGTNSHQVSAIGASIGADGAVDGCYIFNDAGEMGTCVGALSLSPGNYLTREYSYGQAVEMINLSGYPVWCLAAENDGESPSLCQSIPGSTNQAFIFPGRAHGMDLIDPDLVPSDPAVGLNGLELVQEFLEQVYTITLNETSLP